MLLNSRCVPPAAEEFSRYQPDAIVLGVRPYRAPRKRKNVNEAENPKSFLRQVSADRATLEQVGFKRNPQGAFDWYSRQMGPFLFHVRVGTDMWASYWRRLERTGKWSEQKRVPCNSWAEVLHQLKEWGALEADHYRNGAVTGNEPAPVR